VNAHLALPHDEHSTKGCRSHLREQSEGCTSTRGGETYGLLIKSDKWPFFTKLAMAMVSPS